jgi:NAD(P)-dependent dehydrogenase (short-subunit alcohol dehydrogenase family)
MATTHTRWTQDSIPDQSGKRILVTGANSGLGFVTVRELARHGATVLLAVRDQERGEQARADILNDLGGPADISVVPLDLADLASVRALVAHLAGSPLDVLINNAGIMAIPRQLTVDGFERQLGTNHLGHMALTLGLLPNLMATGGSGATTRIVTVSSGAHRLGKIDLDDLMGVRSYKPWRAYGQSKLANLLFTLELQRRLDDIHAPVNAYSAHPGYADTNLQSVGPAMRGDKRGQSMMSWANEKLAQPAAMGALPTLYAATEPGVPAGAFIGPDGFLEQRGYPTVVTPNSAGRDAHMARALWTASEALIGMTFQQAIAGGEASA